MGKPDYNKIEKLRNEIADLKSLSKEFKSEDANTVVSKEDRKKAASGQHGLKDNVKYGQLRKGLEDRIDQLKRDLEREASTITDI